MSEKRYIHIRNWDRHQRFNDRRPRWSRLYFDLHRNDDYMGLTPNRRALLIGLWIEYGLNVRADAEDRFTLRRGLREDTADISRRLAQRVTSADIEALNHAGFIVFSEHETVTDGDGSGSLEPQIPRELETEKNTHHQSTPTRDPLANGRASEEDLPAELRTP